MTLSSPCWALISVHSYPGLYYVTFLTLDYSVLLSQIKNTLQQNTHLCQLVTVDDSKTRKRLWHMAEMEGVHINQVNNTKHFISLYQIGSQPCWWDGHIWWQRIRLIWLNLFRSMAKISNYSYNSLCKIFDLHLHLYISQLERNCQDTHTHSQLIYNQQTNATFLERFIQTGHMGQRRMSAYRHFSQLVSQNFIYIAFCMRENPVHIPSP